MARLTPVLFVILLFISAVRAARDPFRGVENPDVVSIENRDENRIALHTPFGRIAIKLLPENAPIAVAAIRTLAATRGCDENCLFYRAEARPQAYYREKPEGPPYALLQGQMAGLSQPIQLEGDMEVRDGQVAFIPGTRDFIIALGNHPEWGKAHTVVGMIENYVSTDMIAIQPYHKVTHESGTVMRMMDRPVNFKMSPDVYTYDTTIWVA